MWFRSSSDGLFLCFCTVLASLSWMILNLFYYKHKYINTCRAGACFYLSEINYCEKMVSAWKMVGGKGVDNKVISEAEQVTF